MEPGLNKTIIKQEIAIPSPTQLHHQNHQHHHHQQQQQQQQQHIIGKKALNKFKKVKSCRYNDDALRLSARRGQWGSSPPSAAAAAADAVLSAPPVSIRHRHRRGSPSPPSQ